MVLATAYKVSEARQLIEFTLHPNAKFANGDPINAQALKESYAWFLGAKGSGQLRVNGLPSADRIEVVDDVTVRLHLDRPVAWGLIGNALLSSSSIVHAKEILKHATADDPYGTKWLETKTIESGCASPYNLAISPKHFANSRMMIAIKRRWADFLLLFVLIWPIVKWQKWRETPPESRSPHNLAASPYKSDHENRKNRQSVHMFSQKNV